MKFSLDFLDNDVSKLIGDCVNYKKNYNIVLNELKDNVLFTTHLNYYDKYMKPTKEELDEMINNKKETLEQIKLIEGKKGWIATYPEKFCWKISRNDVPQMLNKEGKQNNFILEDRKIGWKYRSYPPHKSLYSIEDLLIIIK
tara:strand:+ start:872 stop:1297 length:426 start_codon:yes stop_codon:yes gene_type:complete